MSHLTEAQFHAARIRCEEVVKAVIARIDSFDFRREVKEKIVKDFGLDKAQNDIENVAFTISYDALRRFDMIATRANSFLSAVQTYVAYNFNMNVDDYRKAVQEAAELIIKTGDNITNTALASTDDELLRTYIRAASSSKKYSTTEELLEAANERMIKSRTYQKRALENARIILLNEKVGTKNTTAEELIKRTNEETHNNAVGKAVRNRVLTAIIKIIKEQGFIVKKENVEECGDHAKISSIKPNGEEANFIVHMDGRFIYKFHGYEGLSCEKDIENFEEKFESIYGIKLDDKKIMWSNPDRLGKMAHQTINNKRIGG